MLKVCEEESEKSFAKMETDMLEGKKMPVSWRAKSDLISIYEDKGGIRLCMEEI